jgi:hypothetical protein
VADHFSYAELSVPIGSGDHLDCFPMADDPSVIRR